ncbi:MAG: hypothetical protein BRD49_03625 [Bacteroidetes bacterium SW_10_40_5]|nr:MAG: hypothetical protein BRD49_03625 [Bacteroidetes bacterium SW_10_40_5]
MKGKKFTRTVYILGAHVIKGVKKPSLCPLQVSHPMILSLGGSFMLFKAKLVGLKYSYLYNFNDFKDLLYANISILDNIEGHLFKNL